MHTTRKITIAALFNSILGLFRRGFHYRVNLNKCRDKLLSWLFFQTWNLTNKYIKKYKNTSELQNEKIANSTWNSLVFLILVFLWIGLGYDWLSRRNSLKLLPFSSNAKPFSKDRINIENWISAQWGLARKGYNLFFGILY